MFLNYGVVTKAVRLITAIGAVSSAVTVVRGSNTLIIAAAKPWTGGICEG